MNTSENNIQIHITVNEKPYLNFIWKITIKNLNTNWSIKEKSLQLNRKIFILIQFMETNN